MPGHGSLSNISRLNIATGNGWWRQCAQSSTMRKCVKLCTPELVLAHCWNSTVCSRSGHLNSHTYFLFITVYCYVATIDLHFFSYAIFCTVANCPLNLAYFNAIVLFFKSLFLSCSKRDFNFNAYNQNLSHYFNTNHPELFEKNHKNALNSFM
jgi:hypothetical protein